MRGRFATLVGVATALATSAPAPSAHAAPELAIQLGRGFAVDSEIDGAFDQGGPHLAASLMWPWEAAVPGMAERVGFRFRFGITAFGTDLGNLVEQIQVTDTTDGSVRDYGSIEIAHLDAWGVGWRVDAVGSLGAVGNAVGSLSYGYIRLEADEVGSVVAAGSAVMGGLAVGIERNLSARHSLALMAGGTLLTDEFTRRYSSVALEWRWRLRAPAPVARP